MVNKTRTPVLWRELASVSLWYEGRNIDVKEAQGFSTGVWCLCNSVSHVARFSTVGGRFALLVTPVGCFNNYLF